MLKHILNKVEENEKVDVAAQVGLAVVVFATGFACALLQHALVKKRQFEEKNRRGTG